MKKILTIGAFLLGSALAPIKMDIKDSVPQYFPEMDAKTIESRLTKKSYPDFSIENLVKESLEKMPKSKQTAKICMPKIPKIPKFDLNPYLCSRYVVNSAEEIFGKKYNRGESWNLHLLNPTVEKIKNPLDVYNFINNGKLSKGMLLTLYIPGSDYLTENDGVTPRRDMSGKLVENTHVLIYMGADIFADQEDDFQRLITLDAILSKGRTPKRILNDTKEVVVENKEYNCDYNLEKVLPGRIYVFGKKIEKGENLYSVAQEFNSIRNRTLLEKASYTAIKPQKKRRNNAIWIGDKVKIPVKRKELRI